MQALAIKPTSGPIPPNWRPYVDKVKPDPWGHPYQYFNHATGTGNGGILRQDLFLVSLNEDYDLYSLGKDGQTAASIGANISLDDIIRASSGAYTGPASQY